MKKKLRSKRGSTLIEILCAFLLIALSTSLFAAAVGAANHINVTTDRYWTSFFKEVEVLENRSEERGTGEMQIFNVGGGTALAEVDIQLYQGSADSDLLYYVPK